MPFWADVSEPFYFCCYIVYSGCPEYSRKFGDCPVPRSWRCPPHAPHWRGAIHSPPILSYLRNVRFSKFKRCWIALPKLLSNTLVCLPQSHRWRHRSGESKQISTLGKCSHVGSWPPLHSSEWTNFWPNHSQLHTEGTITVLTLYLVHLKAKARSQNVMSILKSQICHATYVSWSTLAKEFDYCVH